MSIKNLKSKVGGVNINILKEEILNNIIITTNLDYLHNVDTSLDDFEIHFISPLSPDEQVELDKLILNHKKAIQIFKQSGSSKIDKTKNINLLGYHKEVIIDSKGSLITKNYYKNYDGKDYSDLVVKDEYMYTINAYDLVEYREETISWYLDDGTVGTTKNIKKYYGLKRAIKEGTRRRDNLIDSAKAYGLSSITGTHVSGIPNSHYYFSTLAAATEAYVSGIAKSLLITQIKDLDITKETYITQKIKDDLIAILEYWI